MDGEISRRKIVAEYLEKINNQNVNKHKETESKDDAELNYLSSQIFYQNMQDDKNLIYKQEDQPQIFLMIADSGVPIYSHYFEESFSMDQSLISGFIAAIVHFTDEFKSQKTNLSTNSEENKLQAIRHGGFEIMMEKRENFVTAIIAKKETYSLRRNLITTTNRLEKYFKDYNFYVGEISNRQKNYIKKILGIYFEISVDK